MRKLLPLSLAALALAAPGHARDRLAPEAELALALEGRVAGEPVDCVNLQRIHSTRIIEDTAILYDAGSIIYVNRPRSGAESLDRWDTLLTRTFGSRLCSIDTVRLLDSGSQIPTGLVFLGDFVPYRKVGRAQP